MPFLLSHQAGWLQPAQQRRKTETRRCQQDLTCRASVRRLPRQLMLCLEESASCTKTVDSAVRLELMALASADSLASFPVPVLRCLSLPVATACTMRSACLHACAWPILKQTPHSALAGKGRLHSWEGAQRGNNLGPVPGRTKDPRKYSGICSRVP